MFAESDFTFLWLGHVDFVPTVGCEFFGRTVKLVGRFAPSFQLGGGLKLESRLLVLDLLAEALDVFLNFDLEGAPFRLQLCLRADPSGLVGFRLFLDKER